MSIKSTYVSNLYRHQQKGFTLLETLIALMITGIVAGGVIMVISGIITNNSRNLAHMAAIKQVENAVHWISRDVQMAQHITIDGSGAFPLTFTCVWLNWDNTSCQVVYTVDESGMRRDYTEQVNGVTVKNSNITIARNIVLDPAKTFCQYSDSVFDLTLTAEVNNIPGSSETRVVSIRPRPV